MSIILNVDPYGAQRVRTSIDTVINQVNTKHKLRCSCCFNIILPIKKSILMKGSLFGLMVI